MGTWTRRSRVAAAVLAGVLGAGLLAGCSGSTGAGPDKPDKNLTVWTLENLPARMAATKKVVSRYEKHRGVRVQLVGVDEAQLPQLIMSAAAAGDLPDVIAALPLGQVWQMYGNGLLNTEMPADIIEDLGPGTFDANALRLTADGRKRLSVPSDAWLQLLVYRKDLFARAHLAPPTTYRTMTEAAAKLDKGRMDGISLATDPGDVFTQQSFENVALANDCRLIGDGTGGKSAGGGSGDDAVALDSPACRRAFATYRSLARDHGPPGTQTLDSTRATYFAGRSPMLMWSSFLLDELAGERADTRPSCARCGKDPGFLAKNSGITTAFQGPDARRPGQFGEITSWTVTRTAETEATRGFIAYMMGAGYQGWFGMAPEGKIPVREGTADDPDKYTRAWRHSRLGVEATHRRPLDEIYSDTLLDELADGIGHMRRWGITEGEGALVGATNGELPVAKAVGEMTSGRTPPGEAAREADEEVAALRRSLR
ncbi:extracellular solute-binding protein [Streptomyces albus subsp. chlorinus]|uniref:ABC transporter substrate-binding protein n=1 Tax=Streptomyces albus TaxID=1888 RepID=UPI00156FED7B|nr:extracellular solute-binding protein [Streptomyces albus]NSC24781.1 extracellular solute-binding protein [Streptomyces albus subsp. chlorinus]